MRRIIILLLGLTSAGVLLAEEPLFQPPSFWDQSLVVGIGRVDWVYYHVTNLPRKSVLYCPNFPDLPEGYPDWPKKRLARPEQMPRQGYSLLRDPEVIRDRERENVERSRAAPSLWIRLWNWLWPNWVQDWLPEKAYQTRNFLFLPKVDDQFVLSSTYRYLPPDQFWQLCRSDVILVPSGDEGTKLRAVEQGRREGKLVLLLGATVYTKTVSTENFWSPWSVFVRDSQIQASGSEEEGLAKAKTGWSRAGNTAFSEPDQVGNQTLRKWRILRQTDLGTGRFIDLLVEAHGEIKAPWSLGERGSRFELWVMNWGTLRAELVNCWSTFRQINPKGQTLGLVRLTSSAEEGVTSGESYRLSWDSIGGLKGELGILSWNEDGEGEQIDPPSFHRLAHEQAVDLTAVNPSGATVSSLWWKSADQWLLLAQHRQLIRPLPRVDLAWPSSVPIPPGQQIELSGHFFSEQSVVTVEVQQGALTKLVQKIKNQSDWDCCFTPTSLGLHSGAASLRVEYWVPSTEPVEASDGRKRRRAFGINLVLGKP